MCLRRESSSTISNSARSLLALGERPTSDSRVFSDVVRQSSCRADQLLSDLMRDPTLRRALPSSVAWLAADASIDA
jgi:hypothetical protein